MIDDNIRGGTKDKAGQVNTFGAPRELGFRVLAGAHGKEERSNHDISDDSWGGIQK